MNKKDEKAGMLKKYNPIAIGFKKGEIPLPDRTTPRVGIEHTKRGGSLYIHIVIMRPKD